MKDLPLSIPLQTCEAFVYFFQIGENMSHLSDTSPHVLLSAALHLDHEQLSFVPSTK